MAILKHLASKSTDYGRAVEYLMFQQDRLTNKPLRNEDGCLVMRENFLIDSLECSVPTFDAECRMLNRTYHKNNAYGDIKSHHYIISFDPKDSSEGSLTSEKAQQIGMDFTRKNFPGHQAVVCTHNDGENHSGNIHVHIIINSLRKRDVERQPFMERRTDSKAGFKHHLTDKYLAYLKRDLMKTCEKELLHQVDLLTPAKKKVTEREYWANYRGKVTQGSDFTLRKDMLRNAIADCAKKARSEKDFSKLLREEYNVTLTVSRGRYGYLFLDREKPIRGRILGTDYEEAALRRIFEKNAGLNRTKKTDKIAVNSKAKSLDKKAKFRYPKEFTMDTKLPFVRDLQTSAVSSVNRAYDRKAKISNLKQMAETIMYVETHGFESRDVLDSAYDALHADATSARAALKRSEEGIKALNEQIHYTGQYLANKGVYQAYMKAKNKGRFRSEHEAEIILYEAARKWLKTHADDGTLPSLAYIKSAPGKFVPIDKLKEKRSELIEKQKQLRSSCHSARNAEKELYAIKRNVDTMLKEPHSHLYRSKQKEDVLVRVKFL